MNYEKAKKTEERLEIELTQVGFTPKEIGTIKKLIHALVFIDEDYSAAKAIIDHTGLSIILAAAAEIVRDDERADGPL